MLYPVRSRASRQELLLPQRRLAPRLVWRLTASGHARPFGARLPTFLTLMLTLSLSLWVVRPPPLMGLGGRCTGFIGEVFA